MRRTANSLGIVDKLNQTLAGIAPVWRRLRIVLAQGILVIAATVFTAGASAVVVTPGTSALFVGTTEAARPELAGTVLQDVMEPFTINLGGGSSINGFVQDRVVRETVSGTLDFYYRLFNGITLDGNTIVSDGSIGVVKRDDYTGFATDVDFRLDGLGTVGPSAASRSSTGADVFFGFLTNPIAPGQTSRFFFVKTDATNYDKAGTGSLLGFNSATGGFGETDFSTFEPAAVPLPPALWLFASGLLGLISVVRRR